MHSKINQLIPLAIEAIKTSKISNEKGEVPKEYKGYIASMGSSMIQAGLMPTLAFYSKGESKNQDSAKLLDAIFILLDSNAYNSGDLIHYVLNRAKINQTNIDTVKLSNLDVNKLALVEEEIVQALIALKLALRTFKLIDL